MEESLAKRKCLPCRKGEPPLTDSQIEDYLKKVSDWQIKISGNEDKALKAIYKKLRFKDFRKVMDFLGEIARVAEDENHHPDFCVHYNKIEFTLYTHAIGGLHENDFILAAKIDQIAEDFQ